AGIGGNLGMRKALVFTIAATMAAGAQRIDSEKADPHKVVRVATAPNHLRASPNWLSPLSRWRREARRNKTEWCGNKVFVQPLEPEATTNLFIWTASRRLNYELVPTPASMQDTGMTITCFAGARIVRFRARFCLAPT